MAPKDMLKKLADVLMPPEVVEESQDTAVSEQHIMKQTADFAQAPTLTAVHSRFSSSKAKAADMRISVFKINAFDEVKSVADALKDKQAALVNYEKVDTKTQKRICDFINGVCYVIEGEVKRISGSMVLYLPANISVGDGLIHGADSIFKNDMAS